MSARHLQRRQEIATAAARLMVEEGIRDHGFAKRKAARQLGIGEHEALPTNAEVDAARRSWQSLYRDDEDEARLLALRQAAIDVMRWLAPFTPYLTGSVLDGTAGRYAEIELDLYPESAKEVEIFFLNSDIPYTHRDVRRHLPGAPEAILALDWDEIPVRLALYPQHAERQVRRGSERARLPAVEALLPQPSPTP